MFNYSLYGFCQNLPNLLPRFDLSRIPGVVLKHIVNNRFNFRVATLNLCKIHKQMVPQNLVEYK